MPVRRTRFTLRSLRAGTCCRRTPQSQLGYLQLASAGVYQRRACPGQWARRARLRVAGVRACPPPGHRFRLRCLPGPGCPQALRRCASGGRV